MVVEENGPSPRGWGEQQGRVQGGDDLRTIPTRVGRTAGQATRARGGADHPHAGGENDAQRRCAGLRSGPSPRGWGERLVDGRLGRVVRTIPTRVGRTPPRGDCAGGRTDHPHAGGENAVTLLSVFAPPGPSPRGWGEPICRKAHVQQLRTIPTRVGRTEVPHGPANRRTDHPHAGGENGCPSRWCTGKPDHPHAGGENSCARCPETRWSGPSPRGWGERTSHARRKRFTTDHPHAGGENSALATSYPVGNDGFRRNQNGQFSGSTQLSAISQRPLRVTSLRSGVPQRSIR